MTDSLTDEGFHCYKSSDEPHLLLAKFVRSWDSSSHDDVKFWYERCKDLGPSIPSGCCSWGGNNFIYIFYDQYQLSSVGIAGWELMDAQTYVSTFIYLFNRHLLRTNYYFRTYEYSHKSICKGEKSRKKCLLRKPQHMNALVEILLMSDFLFKEQKDPLLRFIKYAFYTYKLLKRRLNHTVEMKN